MGHFALHCECPGSTSLCTELHAIVHSHTISGLFSQGSSPVWATVGHARRSTEIVSILSFIMLGPVYLRTRRVPQFEQLSFGVAHQYAVEAQLKCV